MAHSPGFPALDLDRDSGLPLGTQLGWRLRTAIASGSLGVGERLPAIREMAALAGVNVNTVRSVYARLADEGVISSEHGRGTFVADVEAARDGVDRMRAALGAGPVEGAEPVPATRAAAAEARRRASLRAEIALLERELMSLEIPNGSPTPAEATAGEPQRGGAPQLLGAAELEAIRDRLVSRLSELRGDRALARAERERDRTGGDSQAPRQRAIATSTPRFETGASGGWSLRWSG